MLLVHVHIYVYIYIYTYTYHVENVCACVQPGTYNHAYKQMCMHVCMHVCVCVDTCNVLYVHVTWCQAFAVKHVPSCRAT